MGLLAGIHHLRQLRTNDPTPVDDRWRQGVMCAIRGMGAVAEEPAPMVFEGLSWRLAPAAAALLTLMALWFTRVDDNLEFHLASLVVSDPAQTDLYNPF